MGKLVVVMVREEGSGDLYIWKVMFEMREFMGRDNDMLCLWKYGKDNMGGECCWGNKDEW